ncbi:NADPH:quinone reductase [Frigidibacter sp. MR17.24]|uniref:NADPH:quinone reductase n=1 Tax=Frigidibacter sp. MR17.24 TaxID=3127345 RepID=UPI003012A48F
MRAHVYHTFGAAADVLRAEDRPRPSPERGEVLVRLRTSGLNPHDTKRRSGWLGGAVRAGGQIPHSDGAGDIAGLGPDVTGRAIGQRVMVFGAGHGRIGGTAADYVSVPAQFTIPLPATCSFEQAAALGVPAITAAHAVLSGGPVADRWVLIHGGLGAVGRAAVDIAVWSGARVIATHGTPARAGDLTALGAHHILDRHACDIAAEVARITGGHGADLIVDVDFGANVAIDAACIAIGGRIAAYSATSNRTPVLPYYDFALKGAVLQFVQATLLSPEASRAAAAIVSARLAAGGLQPSIGHALPLSEIAEGHSLLESGTAKGKIIFVLD